MERTDNYDIARQEACKLFLNHDQKAIIAENKLNSDDDFIYLKYLCKDFKIDKKTGVLMYADGTTAGFGPTLSVFDLLCHKGIKLIDGRFASVNHVKNGPVVTNSFNEFYKMDALYLDKHQKEFEDACQKLGAQKITGADIAYKINVFKNLDMIIKFNASDDEFPPNLIFMWDLNTLEFLNYETVFYVQGNFLDYVYTILKRTI